MTKIPRRSGQVSVEVTIIAILLVIFATLSFNIFVAVWGFTILDSAARDAARAAGAMPTRQTAYLAAKEAALSHQADGCFIGQPLVEDDPNDFQFVENPNGTRPPSGSPYVAVTTRSTIRLPVPIDVFGVRFLTGPYDYTRTYVYPIMNGTFAPPVSYRPVETYSTSGRKFGPSKSTAQHVPAKAETWNAPDTVTQAPSHHVDPTFDSIDSPRTVTQLPATGKSSRSTPPQEGPLEAPAPPAPAPPATTGGF